MAPKRKRPTAVPEEEPVPKRQLRSGGAPTPTPTSSPTKPKVASRRAQSSPRKRVKRSKLEDVESESSADELDVILASLDRGPPAEERCLSDETNTIRVRSSPPLKITDELISAKPKARRGRPRKTQEIKEPAPSGDEVIPAELPRPKGRSPKKRKVDETTPPVEELPSGPVKNIGKLSPAKPETPKGWPRRKQDIQEKVPLAEKGPDHAMQLESVIESEPLDVLSKSMEIDTPTRRRSTRSIPEVVLPATTRAKAKASQRSVTLVAEESTSVNEEQYPPTRSTIPSSKKTIPLKITRITKKMQSQEIKPEREEDGEEDNGDDEEEVSPLVVSSPSRRTSLPEFDPSKHLSGPLPNHLLICFDAYKRAILKTLHCPNIASSETDSPSINDIAAKQLSDLIDGTVLRAEGNSCLLLGPRGSGKSQMVDECLEQVAFNKPIVLRLSGWVQSTDRHALREIAFQLLQQTGTALLPDPDADADPDPELDEEENPFLKAVDHPSEEATLTLPPSSQLHALIPILLTLSRPVIIILDAFDLFALHPRQSLLYCLLDTVQNCRASSESRGIAVIGITSRVDTVQLLEKRVKSRFSGRTIRTAPPGSLQTSLSIVKTILQPSDVCDDEHVEEWRRRWAASVEKFLDDNSVTNVLNETFGIVRDFKAIIRILTTCVLRLTPSQPYLSSKTIFASAETQRSRPRQIHLTNLSYPSLCLLIASAHADTGGHKSFTFEMLHETFGDQVRALASAPVQINGASIGMMRCPREVLISAFEDLVAAKIFVCTIAAPSSIAKQFIKYRCAVDRLDIKGVIEKTGNTNLKKWLNKAQ